MPRQPVFTDLADLPEDERITIIGQMIMSRDPGVLVAVCVDSDLDNYDKADRYVKKLTERFPQVEYVDRFLGPVRNVTTLRFRRRLP